MVKINQNATMYAGNRKILRFTLTDEDNNDDPLDVSTYTIHFAIAGINASTGQPITSNPKLDLNSDDQPAQVVFEDAPNGLVRVILLPADTADITPGTYYIEVEGVDGSSNPEVLATGELTIEPNVDNV